MGLSWDHFGDFLGPVGGPFAKIIAVKMYCVARFSGFGVLVSDSGSMDPPPGSAHVAADHKSPPTPGSACGAGEDKPVLEDARQILDAEAARREAIFNQSVADEKGRSDALAKRFEEALKNASSEPVTKPVRDFDLD